CRFGCISRSMDDMAISASVTSLSRNGMADWLFQRITAVLLAVYTVGIVGYFLFTGEVDYDRWKGFMGSLPMQIINSIVMLSILAHAWVGLWTVTTDYFTPVQLGNKAAFVRLVVQT